MTWVLVQEGKLEKFYTSPKPITVNGVQHPKTIFTSWSQERLKEIGLYNYKEENSKVDTKFYRLGPSTIEINNQEGTVTKTYQIIAKDLEEVKGQTIKEAREIAGTLLQPTDWYVVRKSETGKDIPLTIVDFRNNVRTKYDEIFSAVESCSTLEDLISLYEGDTLDWPATPSSTYSSTLEERIADTVGKIKSYLYSTMLSGYNFTFDSSQSATFSVDMEKMIFISGIVQGLDRGDGFPQNASPFLYSNTAGSQSEFTQGEFIRFAVEVRDWVDSLQETAIQKIGTVSLIGSLDELKVYLQNNPIDQGWA